MSQSKEITRLVDLLIVTDEKLHRADLKMKEAEKALLALENGCSSFRVMQILKGVFA